MMSRSDSSLAATVFAALGSLLVVACGGSPEGIGAGADGGQPATGGVIDGPIGEWVWYDIPGAICANGTQTGIGVNQGSGSRVVIYMSGGGACLDEDCTIGALSLGTLKLT
jgi:hypothetical protein